MVLFLAITFISCTQKGKEKKAPVVKAQNKVVSYDEIAEGMSRKFSKIENNVITVIDELYTEEKQTKFNSNIRPNESILLNHIYSDTIEFDNYNDGGDYFLLLGKKNEVDISFIYSWKLNNSKYNFKYGDLIEIKWKMDSIWIAGDGETLDFTEHVIDAEKIISENKLVRFLWRADKFDQELNQEVNSIFINESFCNTISNQEKAALGYISFNIGSECWWDGKVNENRSNLKCKIVTSLDLGYQCSDKQLNFLRKWFSNDSVALKELKSCSTTPYTATVQSTFDEISIFTDDDNKTISVTYKAYGVNIREAIKWSWTQTDTFKYTNENIALTNSEKFELIREKSEIKEN